MELKRVHIRVGIRLSESVFVFFFLLFVSGEAIILGFQHYILALGTAVMIPTVLVPMMGGDDVSFLCAMPPSAS
jgi:hypothetical protein